MVRLARAAPAKYKPDRHTGFLRKRQIKAMNLLPQ
jgi:hypothetical protein